MKQKVSLHSDNTVLFKGRISDVPIKHNAIINRSIALFDDNDPCIIHQSYVIKEYVDRLLERFASTGTNTLVLHDHPDLDFLDVPQENSWVLELLGK